MRSVPPALAAAFEGKLTITVSELCQLLPLDQETLRQHIRHGHISYVQLGFGQKAPRRAFTLENVVSFLEGQGRTEQLPEIKQRRRAVTALNGKAASFLTDLEAAAVTQASAAAGGFLARRAQRLAQTQTSGGPEPRIPAGVAREGADGRPVADTRQAPSPRIFRKRTAGKAKSPV